MKTTKLFFALIFLILVLFITVQLAAAGCNATPQNDPLEPNGQAPGQKWEGPIAVYYEEGMMEEPAKICWYGRLRKGQERYGYGGCTSQTYDDNELSSFQTDAINYLKKTFFPTVIIEDLYDCTYMLGGGGDCPQVELKSYGLDVSESEALGPAPGLFFVMDLVIAVDE